MLSGFNGQEGSISAFLPTLTNATQEPFTDGLSLDYVKIALLHTCEVATPPSVNLCVEFYINTYGLDTTDDDKERGVRLSYALGMCKIINTYKYWLAHLIRFENWNI